MQKNKVLTLKQIKDLSNGNFDNMISLYKQGHTLLEDRTLDNSRIQSLYSLGEIVHVTASKDTTLNKTYVNVMFYHDTGNATKYVNLIAYMGTYVGNVVKCRGGFTDLLRGDTIYVAGSPVSTDITVRSKTCSGTDGCPLTATCTTETEVGTGTIIPAANIVTHDPSAPGNVTNMAVIPSDGTLKITWTAPTGSIWAYYINISTASNPYVKNGYIKHILGTNNYEYTATGLGNGIQHTVQVRAKTNSGIEGAYETKIETPGTARWACDTNYSCVVSYESTAPYATEAECLANCLAPPSAKEGSNMTMYLLLGAVVIGGIVILSSSKKKEQPREQSRPYEYRTVPPTVQQVTRPTTQSTTRHVTRSAEVDTQTKEESTRKEIEELNRQKEDAKRLKELEEKKYRLKGDIAKTYIGKK